MELSTTREAVVIKLDYDEATMLNTILDLSTMDSDFRDEEASYAALFAKQLADARRSFWRGQRHRMRSEADVG